MYRGSGVSYFDKKIYFGLGSQVFQMFYIRPWAQAKAEPCDLAADRPWTLWTAVVAGTVRAVRIDAHLTKIVSLVKTQFEINFEHFWI